MHFRSIHFPNCLSSSHDRRSCWCAVVVGMQACGDVILMIGQHGRSMHEAIPHICGAKAIPTFYFLSSSSPRIKIVNQLNQRLCDLLTSLMTLLLVVNLTANSCVTVRSRQMQLQMPCIVGLRERPLELHISEPRSYVFEPHLSSLALSSLTFMSLTLRVPPFWASPCRLSTLLWPCPHCTRSLFSEHSSYLSHVNATHFEAN